MMIEMRKHFNIYEEGVITPSFQKAFSARRVSLFQSKWDKCAEVDHSNPNNAVNYISDVLMNAADKAKIKYAKQQ